MTSASRTAIQRRIAALEAELVRLDALPTEPIFEDGEPTVIWFCKQFAPGGRTYTYAAVRAENGYWYTTGPEGGTTPRTWEALTEWLGDTEVWTATTWERLT